MRKSWKTSAVAFACVAGLAAGCGGESMNDERRAQGPEASAQPAAGTQAVSLSGCVEAAPGTNQYVLRNVRVEPRAGGDPQAASTVPAHQGITEGAWVRLDGRDHDLKGYLGQRVSLTGTMADSGANTIGTAGTSGVDTPSGDKSQAAATGEHHADKQKKEMGRIARESMADGTAPEVRVQQVQASGEPCVQGEGVKR